MARSTVEEAAARAARDRDASLLGQPELRRRRGIVHTPAPLARFVVEEVDLRLRVTLGLAGGIGDPRVGLIDPACGPGAFLAAALAVGQRLPGRPGAVVGCDLDRGALAQAEAVLRPVAEGLSWPLALQCGDTLRETEPLEGFPGTPIRVVLGNPPWAGRSESRGAPSIEALLEDFRRDGAGARLAERKLGVLSDAYVRFVRWSAEVVRRAPGGGVVALVTNGSYLDGPVHRGMREALLRWFATVEVLDLGGSALLGREGPRDENVFGVRPSVAVMLAVRPPGHLEAGPRGVVRYARLEGRADAKLAALGARVPRAELAPVAPAFLFVPTPERGWEGLAGAVSLDRAMPFHAEGVQTNRDAAAVALTRGALIARLQAFVGGVALDELEAARRSSGHYDVDAAVRAIRDALARDPDGTRGIAARPLAYRPYDGRWFAPVAPFCHRPRFPLLAAVDASSGVLLTVRKDRGERSWAHVAWSTSVPDSSFLSSRSSCRTRAFPTHDPHGAENLDPELVCAWSVRIGAPLGAHDFARYALAVLASPTYRRRFDRSLRLSYPHLPPPPDGRAFEAVVSAGRLLAAALSHPEGGSARATIGHVRVTRAPESLDEAFAAADRAVSPLLGR